jgi:hypothetical protein
MLYSNTITFHVHVLMDDVFQVRKNAFFVQSLVEELMKTEVQNAFLKHVLSHLRRKVAFLKGKIVGRNYC